MIGVTSPVGAPIMDFMVGHGIHPDVTMWEAGYIPIRPLSANLVDGEITVVQLVRALSRVDRPQRRKPRRPETDIGPDEIPQLHQRVAAYAVVTSSRGILGTVCSPRTSAPGIWMLPGGGLDPHESPAAAVLREIHEETGQEVRLDRLLAIQSDHWIGRAPGGALEDFHALRIIYSATCEHPTQPVVHDLAGTTERAAWVSRTRWRALPWTAGARSLLKLHVGGPTW